MVGVDRLLRMQRRSIFASAGRTALEWLLNSPSPNWCWVSRLGTGSCTQAPLMTRQAGHMP